jgi:tetratricopeptide (TPR) repeat protein
VRELESETANYFRVVSLITLVRGDAEDALRLALQSIEVDSTFSFGHDALGKAYWTLGNKEETVNARAEVVSMRENDKNAHFDLLNTLHELGDTARLRAEVERAIPIFERHTRLNQDDYDAWARLANIIRYSGRES